MTSIDQGRDGGTGGKKAVLILRESPGEEPDSYRMSELKGLAGAAGYAVLAEITQRRGRDHRYQVGRGKILEALSFSPDKLIFYNPLSPGQVYTLGSEFSIPVIDRFNLILEVFASRAQTKEAKMQVELARLTYDAPHVKRALSVQKMGEQPGYRGAGAYEQSMYKDIRGRIAKIKASLKDVESMGEDRRQRRRELGFDLVALAGYTNAGKSTLLNALTRAEAEAKDQPFTTLSPTTRAVRDGRRKIMLTDTVGFIDDLPHFLIKAFRSTLSEISQADLILLVADASDPPEVLRRKLAASHKALWDCSTSAPIITVLNKVDRLNEVIDGDGKDMEPDIGCAVGYNAGYDAGHAPELDAGCDFDIGYGLARRYEAIKDLAPNPVFVSASSGLGLNDLLDRIHERLRPLKEYQVRLPYTSEGLRELSRLYNSAELLRVSYEDAVVVTFRGKEEAAAAVGAVGDIGRVGDVERVGAVGNVEAVEVIARVSRDAAE